MDKKIWLKVIKDELTLLDELATGMINDVTLSREEVELAVTRSKIVVKEFEMLMNQIPAKENAVKVAAEYVTQEMADSFSPPLVQTLRPSVSPSPSPPVVESSPRHFVKSPSLQVSESPSPQVSESPSPPVVESPPRPLVPSSDPIHDTPILQVSESPLRQAQGPESHTLDLDPSTGSGSTGVAFAPSPPRPLVESSSPLAPSSQPEDHTEYTQYFKIEPLKSLKEGLSLNDRYLFQRELFNNDKSRLDETVAALDRLNNIKEAVDYLKANFKWNKSDAADKFVTLIKRRFSEPKG